LLWAQWWRCLYFLRSDRVKTGTTILPPHGGLISDQGAAAPDSEAVPKRENRLLNNWLSEKDGDGRQGDRAVCAFRCF
jgi:hypothetical protein